MVGWGGVGATFGFYSTIICQEHFLLNMGLSIHYRALELWELRELWELWKLWELWELCELWELWELWKRWDE